MLITHLDHVFRGLLLKFLVTQYIHSDSKGWVDDGQSRFKWKHFAPEIILWSLCWYGSDTDELDEQQT